MSVIEITNSNIEYLTIFIKNTFPSTFRYFNNKTPEIIIKNHYKTLIYIEDNIPIGYTHIDYDIINNKYWFGICILSEHHGKGIGTKLIKNMLDVFINSNIDTLHLTVDKTNIIAYNMYLKHGFKLQRETDAIYIMSLVKSNILYLPVSHGEAIDKLTILDIKMNKIMDVRKKDVEVEYNKLYFELKDIVKISGFYYNALKQINLQIWEDQDKFRYSTNDNGKNILCKKIIEDNDARFRIKNKINYLFGSFLKEQKGYIPKIFKVYYSSNTEYHTLLNSIIKYHAIFNDKVTVLCNNNMFEYITRLFKHDSTIEINLSSTMDTPSGYVEMLNNTINNKEFFNFIEST